ncbi:MAG: adenylate/guanylate cyclase domain-containing protein [Actinomycetota bacterium]
MSDLLSRARPTVQATVPGRHGDPGTEAPPGRYAIDEPSTVHRSFAFLDVCGFTKYTEKHGNLEAVRMLRTFRDVARVVAARRGVRIAKWLGDGVMMVGVDAGPVAATAVELTRRIDEEGISLRGGVASGSCLLFEGDDYIGRCVNLASRLSDAAGPGEVLADANTASLAPDWVEVGKPRSRRIHGFGKIDDISALGVQPG